jgi:hypothetical protein
VQWQRFEIDSVGMMGLPVRGPRMVGLRSF